MKQLALSLLFTAIASAATVTVSDTLVLPDGTNPSGRLFIGNPTFTTAGGTRIAASVRVYAITSGVINLTLESTTDATPSGVSYNAVYQLDTGRNYSEIWVIPTTGPVTIAEIVTDPAPSPSVMINPIVLTQSGAATNECLIWNGSAWQPGSCSAGSGVIPCIAPLTELTISSGSITVASSACYAVDTEADAASDDLATINCTAGDFFVLVPADSARTVVVKASLGMSSDFALDNVLDSIYFRCPTANTVGELARTNGGP